MRRVDRDRSRYKKSIKRLSHKSREAVDRAIELFLRDPIHPSLDFKHRVDSRYWSIRAGAKPGNLRIVFLQDDVDKNLFIAVFVGNHDDLNSLDHQKR